MRGNSGYLRWWWMTSSPLFEQRRSSLEMKRSLALIIVLLAVIVPAYHAGPISNTRHRRMIREIFSEPQIGQNDTQSDDGAICLLDGIEVPKNSVKCEQQPGCRAIQKTGYCCPDFQCDCERDGKIYANGVKLVDPQTPCNVCYCQGGEMICNLVKCYVRQDCTPKFTEGKCCPIYEGCPPLEDLKISSSSSSKDSAIQSTMETTEHSSSFNLNSSMIQQRPQQHQQSTVVQPQPHSNKAEMMNNNPLGIKIKEITKPEEIRIVDDKPKSVIYPISSSKSTENSNGNNNNQQLESKTANIDKRDHSSTLSSENEKDLPSIEESDEKLPQIKTTTVTLPKLAVAATSSATTSTPNLPPSPPSSASIPPTTSAENQNKLEAEDAASATNNEESSKIVRHTNSLINKNSSRSNSVNDDENKSKIESDNSNNNNNNEQETENKVVIYDITANKPITVFGADGLERGDIADEIAVKSDAGGDPDDSIDDEDKDLQNDEEHKRNPLDLDSASSNDEYVKVLPISTTESSSGLSTENNSSDEDQHRVYETILYTSGPSTSSEAEIDTNSSKSDEKVHETIYHSHEDGEEAVKNFNMSTKRPIVWTSESKHQAGVLPHTQQQHHHHVDDYDTTSNEPNPAYPAIFDEDLSIFGREEVMSPLTDAEEFSEGGHHKLQATGIQKANLVKLAMNQQHSDGKELARASQLEITTEDNILPVEKDKSSSTSAELIESFRTPGEPLLIPEWERNVTTTEIPLTNSNESGTSSKSNDTNEWWKIEELEAGSGSGSGSGLGQVLFDELEASADSELLLGGGEPSSPSAPSSSSSSSIKQLLLHNPKNDAESFKLIEGNSSEDENQGVLSSDLLAAFTDEQQAADLDSYRTLQNAYKFPSSSNHYVRLF